MEFFTKFKQLYNFSKSIESTEELHSSVSEDVWYEFQDNIKDYSFDMFEVLYKVIVHYHYIETKKLEDFPYKLRLYNGSKVNDSEVRNGIVFEPKNLPLCLQYMLLHWY